MNQVKLVGRVVRCFEPSKANGHTIYRVVLAVDRPKKNAERPADFPMIEAWNKVGEPLIDAKPGNWVGLEGRVKTNRFGTGDDTRWTTCVQARVLSVSNRRVNVLPK